MTTLGSTLLLTPADTADSSDNVDGATNIAKGLAAGHSPENPAYWLHVSGTNILTWYDNDNDRAGEPPLDKETYHDIRDVDRIVNLPDHASHRNVDIIVQNAASDSIRPAILCPPMIYGKGTGVVNTRSIQIPDLAKGALEKGFAPIVGQGKTEWHYVHVQDLSEVFLLLADATQDSSKASDPEIFGPKAYYFVEDGAFLWADIAKKIAEVASKQGYLPEPLTKSVTQKEATLMEGVATTTYGQNAKGIAERAKKYLGWKAKEPLPLETIEEVVAIEAKSLGLTPKEKTA